MKNRAFTLIELLIVVAIIGILAAIAVPNFMNARIRAKVVKSVTNERTLLNAYMQYSVDNGRTPEHSDTITAQDRLTTPITYINARIPDFFKDGLEERNIPVPHAGLYHAEPYLEIKTLQEYPKNLDTGFNAGNSAVILGYGPTRQYHYHEYDPSNGVVSDGGILAWVPRSHEMDFAPKWYSVLMQR
ncbi:MAG: prepilin-type N-terminal cleavage/methylation domain-containing protein [bacterium]